MSDRIAVMRNGAFDQVAAKTEVYTKPATAFVASFVGQPTGSKGACRRSTAGPRSSTGRAWSLSCRRRATCSRAQPSHFSIKYEDVEIVRGGRRGHDG